MALLVNFSFTRVVLLVSGTIPQPLVVADEISSCAQMMNEYGVTPYSTQHCSTA